MADNKVVVQDPPQRDWRLTGLTALGRFGHHDADCKLKCSCGHYYEHHSGGLCLNCGQFCNGLDGRPARKEIPTSCTCGFYAAMKLLGG